jgi:hypothetical protein
MNKFGSILIISALVWFVFLSGCENPVSADLDQEFKLKVGRQAFIEEENLKIFFISVPEDSRCPIGAVCFWSGNGEVSIELVKDYDETIDTLNTHIDPNSAQFLNYQVILKNLDPYPVEGELIDPKNYVATLVVKKIYNNEPEIK